MTDAHNGKSLPNGHSERVTSSNRSLDRDGGPQDKQTDALLGSTKTPLAARDSFPHSHSDLSMKKGRLSSDNLPHSHSDLSYQAKPKAQQFVRLNPELRASASSATWGGSQAHVFSSHMSLDRLDTRSRDRLDVGVESPLVADGAQPDDDQFILAPTGRVTLPLGLAAFIAVFGSSFPHGYNTSVLNNPTPLIKEFLNETYVERYGSVPQETMLNFLWSLSVSIYLVGGCGGAFSVGVLANKLGRKKALLVCHVFGFVSAILFGFCKMAGSFEMLILARLIVGYGCGAGSGLVPMYLTEIAPVNIRGAMGVLHQFGLTVGILVSNILGLSQILGTEDMWPCLLALVAVPCLVSSIALPFFPESPRYLYVNKKDTAASEKALQRFRQEDDVSACLAEMDAELRQQEKEPEWSFKMLFSSRNLKLPLALISVLAVAQQLSGINVVFYYSTGVFEASGIPSEYTQFATMGAGFINVVMTAISVPLMEKVGRRKLLLGGMICMVASDVVMTIALNLQEKVSWLSYFTIVCTITFVIGFAIGLGSIPQFIGAELFKQGPRPPAMSFGGLLNWLANFIVGISFPLMAPYTGPYSFIPFMVICIAFGTFLWIKLPETKGKTYDEIWRHFVTDEEVTTSSPENTSLLSVDRPANGTIGGSGENKI